MTVKHAIAVRKEKLKNEDELVKQLTAGKSFFGYEAAEMGLVDAVISPDEYLTETLFKG